MIYSEKINDLIKQTSNRMFHTGHDVYLAGLGIAVTITDQYAKTFDELVDKGRTVSKKEEKPEKEKREIRILVKAREMSHKMEGVVQEGIAKTLGRFGIPSKHEIRDLTASVENLAKKIQAMQTKTA